MVFFSVMRVSTGKSQQDLKTDIHTEHNYLHIPGHFRPLLSVYSFLKFLCLSSSSMLRCADLAGIVNFLSPSYYEALIFCYLC